MPKRERAQYMREYRARKRREAQGTATATAAPFDFQDVDVERAIAEPPSCAPPGLTAAQWWGSTMRCASPSR